MVRKVPGKSPSKKSRKNDGEKVNSETSVHKRNLCIVSFPIVFLFNIFKSLIYQIFVILRFLYYSSVYYILKQPRQLDCLENNQEDSSTSNSVKTNVVMPLTTGHSGPGPGDPLLAKQKHHHRRAFEFISKALKIDEENEGKTLVIQEVLETHHTLIQKLKKLVIIVQQ